MNLTYKLYTMEAFYKRRSELLAKQKKNLKKRFNDCINFYLDVRAMDKKTIAEQKAIIELLNEKCDLLQQICVVNSKRADLLENTLAGYPLRTLRVVR